MNREDVIRMAQDAGIVVTGEAVWKLCEMVAAAEREACASILDRNVAVCGTNSAMRDVLAGNALAVRARGDA